MHKGLLVLNNEIHLNVPLQHMRLNKNASVNRVAINSLSVQTLNYIDFMLYDFCY